ncbi:hypothetical protein DXG01_002816 [Tephrocybe rancida]|nr:hypothetical protein DXG01_002816 [Tephrocybe rancida]
MRRIAYDADVQVYTFRDRDGKLYKGAPGADYGILTPVEDMGTGSPRPEAFDSESDEPRSSPVRTGSAPSTFYDILPATLITSTKSPVDKPHLSHKSPTSPQGGEHTSARSKFISAVRRSALPKMHGVAHDLRRSVTSARAKGSSSGESNKPLRWEYSELSRSNSVPKGSGHSAKPGDGANLLHRGHGTLDRSGSIATTHSITSTDTPISVKYH